MNKNNIKAFIHCKMCLDEIKLDQKPTSPEEYAWLSCGWTTKGIQLWCARHECNVIHIDFEGYKHPADVTRKKK